MENVFDCVIVGYGPCGIGASLVLKQAGLNITIIEKDTPGGKVNIAPRVDNYPGFTKIPGPDLAVELVKRAKAAEVPVIMDEILSLTKEEDNLFLLLSKKGEYHAKTVLIASGTLERKLGLEREDEMLGHGLSYCAICDGHFFKGKDILVAGGGNAALKEALYLSSFVKHIYLIHRRNQFRGLAPLVKEIKEVPNITIMTPYVPVKILGDDHITGMRIRNVETNEEKDLDVEGFFPLVGQIPSTQYINIPGVKNEYNCIPVDNATRQTSVPGLYAGGDVLPREIKQIYLSEFDGKTAAKNIIEYLKTL